MLIPTEQTNKSKTSTLFHPSFLFLHDQMMTRVSGWLGFGLGLGFLLLISMCDDVAEGLVVNVASWVDGSDSKGLVHLQPSTTQRPFKERVQIWTSFKLETNLFCCKFICLIHQQSSKPRETRKK